MVFYGGKLYRLGEPRRAVHPHDAGPAMRAALAPLALGTLTTWLLAGPFSQMLASSLPYHHLHAESTLRYIGEVLFSPATYLALAVVACGLAAWYWRQRLEWLQKPLAGLSRLAAEGFGFEWINQQVVIIIETLAGSLRQLQTGQLNWNLVGVLAGLVIVLAWLALAV
jgi:NADH-quinone oxidoreductase subunit L